MQITRLDLPACSLGESPLWCPDEQAFYWVDGLAPALFRMDWRRRRIERQGLRDTVGSITRAEGGGVVLALSRGLAVLRFGGVPGPLLTPADLPAGVRFNDSKCDGAGRVVAGTMDLAERDPVGAAYIFAPGGESRVLDAGYTVFNGPCWSADGRVLYLSDSAQRRVFRFDYDPLTGRASGKAPWLQLSPEEGLPDGATVDAAGRYWQARNGAGKIVQHAPDGRVLRELALPTANVTSLAFGGPDLDVLLVTSMDRLLPGQMASDAHAGGIFLIEGTGSQGRVEPLANLAPGATGMD